ncbi:VOC family protein [Tahibacter harae]|nr:VOC family protein [Tahibacter harae]
MRILSQLAFNGTCRQAFAYYESVLKGKVVVMNAHGDSRDIPLPPGSRASAPEHIRFAELHVGEWALLGNDVPAEDYEPMRGFNVALHADSVEEAQRIFNALAQGGEIRAPLTQMPWAARFGQLVDRFGTPWLILALPG